MNKRLDPTQKVVDVDGVGVVDFGDRAKTYVFGEDAEGFKLLGGSSRPDLLKEIAQTGDWKWDEDGDNGDGGNRNIIELKDSFDPSKAADDFVALVEAAARGDAGLSLIINGADEIEIHASGRWSTDILKFSGDYVTDALTNASTGFDLQNRTDQFKVFTFDADQSSENIFTGGGRDLAQGPDVFDNFFDASFLNDGAELEAVVNAALDDYYGLSDTTDMKVIDVDDDSLVFEITTNHGKAEPDGAQKTFILNGTEVEALIAAYSEDLTAGTLDTGDGKSRTALFDTDANTGGSNSIFFGGGKNDVTFDAGKTITLDDVVGNRLNQRENASNVNQQNTDDIDEFVFNVLQFDGDSDVSVIAGGEAGDDFMTVEMLTDGGNTDTLILQGDRVGDAIDQFAADGTQFDFFLIA